MRRGHLAIAVVCLAFLGLRSELVYAQSNQSRPGMWAPKLSGPSPGEIQVLPVQGKVWVLTGAGGNITVQAGDDGILMVDTGTAATSDKGLAALATISAP